MKKSLFALTLCAMLLLIFACKKDKSGPATADFDVPGGQLYANCSVEFINASSGATTYLWDFGDGNASNEADPIHAYDTPGTYTITLTVSDEDTEDTATQTVQVGESTKFKKQFTLPVPATRNMQVMNASNGGYVGIASGLKGGRDGFMDVVIFKTDANGNFQWEISLEGFGSFISPGLTPTSDGGYLVSGRTEPIMYTDASALVIKIDANGILHWEGLFDDFFRIDATDMSDMVIGRNDGFHLLTFGANGNIQSDTYLGSSDFYISDIISTSDGGYILAGSKEVGTDNRDAYSTKVDKNGNLQWEKTFGGSGWDTFGSVTIASDGGFVNGKKLLGMLLFLPFSAHSILLFLHLMAAIC